MDRPTTPILGVPISTFGLDQAVEFCAAQASSGKGGYVCFANVHTVTECQSDTELLEVMKCAFLALADGVPLVWVSRWGPNPIASRVCGPDFTPEFIRRYPDLPMAFIGGSPGTGEKIAAKFDLPARTYSPPMRAFSVENALDDWSTFLARNGGKAPKVVWVGLGAPKQEYWMKAVSRIAPQTLFFGVGAAFDFLAETKARAPRWMQKIGLEWFYRLLQEPGRLAERYFATNLKFLCQIFKEKFVTRDLR